MSRAVLQQFRISSYAFPRDRTIGDAQIAVDMNWVGALELFDVDGEYGLGFFLSLFAPLPPQSILSDYFARNFWPTLEGSAPEGALHRVARSRGGNFRPAQYQLDTAVDQALWDIAAKRAGMPLHRYLGSTSDIGPRAYVSGLEFNMNDADTHAFYRTAMARGYDGVKVKVGHTDIGWDIARMALVQDAVGPDKKLMIDANESWTVSETLCRVEAFAKAGYKLHWVEDPILRNDMAGLQALKGALGPVMLNSGEYLNTRGKRSLIDSDACDIINLDGNISDGLRLAWVAAESGMLLALGNSNMNLAAHMGAALPAITYVEDAMLNTDNILAEPLAVSCGRFVLPNRNGHGLSLAEDASVRFGT